MKMFAIAGMILVASVWFHELVDARKDVKEFLKVKQVPENAWLIWYSRKLSAKVGWCLLVLLGFQALMAFWLLGL